MRIYSTTPPLKNTKHNNKSTLLEKDCEKSNSSTIAITEGGNVTKRTCEGLEIQWSDSNRQPLSTAKSCCSGYETNEMETNEETTSSDISFNEPIKLGEDANDTVSDIEQTVTNNRTIEAEEEFRPMVEDPMRQDKALVKKKLKENEGKAERQMGKIRNQIEKLRIEMCSSIQQEDGSERSCNEKQLKAENEFLVQVNEMLHSRLYNVISMLEVEEDYSVKLEAKIEKLEEKLKERDGVINQLSSRAVESRANMRMEKMKEEWLMKSNLGRQGSSTSLCRGNTNKKIGESKLQQGPPAKNLETDSYGLKSQVSLPKKEKIRITGKRSALQRSKSHGNICIDIKGDIEEDTNSSILSSKSSDRSWQKKKGEAKKRGKQRALQRSMSQGDVCMAIEEDTDRCLGSLNSDSSRQNKNKLKKVKGKRNSLQRSRSQGDIYMDIKGHIEESMNRSAHSKSLEKSASFLKQQPRKKKKKKKIEMRGNRKDFQRSKSQGDIFMDIDSDVEEALGGSTRSLKSLERAISSEKNNRKNKNKDKSKMKGKRGDFQRSKSDGDLCINIDESDIEEDDLVIASKSGKSRTKRYCNKEEEASSRSIIEEGPTETLKNLIVELWS